MVVSHSDITRHTMHNKPAYAAAACQQPCQQPCQPCQPACQPASKASGQPADKRNGFTALQKSHEVLCGAVRVVAGMSWM